MIYTEQTYLLDGESRPFRRVVGRVAVGTGLGYHVNELEEVACKVPATCHVIDHIHSGTCLKIDVDSEQQARNAIERLIASGIDWTRPREQLLRENGLGIPGIIRGIAEDMKTSEKV